jgi:hypothetical protein
MDVTEFLDKLGIVPDVEIVITLLPEMVGKFPTQAKTGLEWGTHKTGLEWGTHKTGLEWGTCLGKVPPQAKGRLEWGTRRGTREQAAGHALLERLESIGEEAALGFAEQ